MNKEDKYLLLKDLSGRIPYRPNVLLGEKQHCVLCGIDGYDVYLDVDSDSFRIESIKPFLRPMPSMTKEELKEYHKTFFYHERYDNEHKTGQNCSITFETYDWLNAHHFDYRGLIVKGLALEAPEGMYNIK